jgi:TonB family protein
MSPNPPRRRRTHKTPAALVAFAASVGLHVAGVLLVLGLGEVGLLFGPRAKPARPVQAVGLRTLNAEEWARNRGEPLPSDERQRVAESRPSPPKRQEPKKKEKEEIPKGQIVDVAPGNGESSPDAKYIAETANKAQKETRAKDQTAFYRNAMPKRTSPVPNENAGTAPTGREGVAGNDGLGDDDRPLRENESQKLALEVPDVKARDELRLQRSDEGAGPVVANRQESAELRGNSKRLRIQPGAPDKDQDGSRGRAGSPGLVTLTPSTAVLDDVSGAAPNDHLEDVDEGDGTYLNTREWKFASFFNRVKKSVGMNWDPARELRVRDPTGSLYGGRDRHTVLQVTLNQRGMVQDISVLKSCGLDFLDLEALHSFQRAQPFPNPPSGLLTSDSTVSFSFGFFVELSGAPRLRMFRSGN